MSIPSPELRHELPPVLGFAPRAVLNINARRPRLAARWANGGEAEGDK